MRKFASLFLCFLLGLTQLWAQNRTITGRIVDEKKNPLAGVTVSVTGNSKVKTTTDANGNYTISVPADAKSLTFSYVGYGSQDVAIGSSTNVSTVLQPNADDIGGVVVTGFKRVEKTKFAGAAARIDTLQLRNQPVGSFDQILQGRVPGVLSLTSSGQPGNPANIIIRGTGSILGGTTPLYIVDGIPVEASVFQGYNPNDFESVDVLRDAAGTALYGSRGSAGVIIVTTRRGKAGRMKFSYSGQYGVKERPNMSYEMMNSAELLKAQERYGLAGGTSANAQENIPGWYYSKLNPNYASLTPAQQAQYNRVLDSLSGINTNWRDEVFRTGTFTNHQITLSGGTGKTRVYSSLGYYNEEGTTLRTDMKRVTLRNNIDYGGPTDKFTFSFNSNLSYVKRNFQQSTTTNGTGNPFLIANISVPYLKLYNADGSYATGTGPQYVGANALDLTKYDQNYNNQVKATLGIVTAYKITNDITLGLTTGIDFRETQSTNYGSRLAYVRKTSTSVTGQAGFQSEALTRFFQGTIRPSIGYRKTFAQKHAVDFTVYGEYIKQESKSISMVGYGIDPRTPNTPAAVTQGNGSNQLFATVGGGRSQNALVSGLGVLTYTYNNKYTITGTYRRDGSSKLPVDTRWQGFYSVGGVWEATREDFLKSVKALNTLRVKLSYGGSGNADNFPGGDYPYQATYGVGGYGGLNTIVATYPGNPSMKWETIYTLNLGIEFEALDRRLYGEVNFYDRRTKDLFVQKTLSATSGFGAINVNAGELQNKGVEMVLNYDVIKNRNITWTVFGNAAYNKNKVLSLGGEPSFEQGTELVTVGLPLGSHYEVKWAGVDAATGAPLYYDLNGKVTNVYSASNAVQQFGTWEAPWKGGFGSRLSFKGFDLSVLFSWQRGANKSNNLEYFMENPVGFLSNGYNQAKDLNFWAKPGDVASTPSPLYSVNFSSKLIHDASFIRLKDVVLSYTLPKNVTQKLKVVSNARFFVQGSNLFIWTKWKGMDPEAGATNINLSEFPNPRAYTAGLEVNF